MRSRRQMGDGGLLLPSLIGAYQVGVMALPYVAGQRPTSEKRRYIDYTDMEPWDRVKLAEELARSHSMDPPMREMAAYILDTCADIPGKGALKIAEWIRWRIRYFMESPGIEILQGPYDTLATRVADCDDAAILFTTLGKSCGLQIRFCGVGEISDPSTLVHAVGYDARTGVYYELVDDGKYGGRSNPPLIWTIPDGMFTMFWSPDEELYFVDLGLGPIPQEEKNMIRMMGVPSPSAGAAGPGPSSSGSGDTPEWIMELIRQAGAVGVAALGPDQQTDVYVAGGPAYEGYSGYTQPRAEQQEQQYTTGPEGNIFQEHPMLVAAGLLAAGWIGYYMFREA